MTFKYKLDSYSMEIHWMCKYELPMLKSFKRYSLTDSQTWLKLYAMLIHGCSIIN